MFVFGLLVGTLDIIAGIWTLANSQNYGFMVFSGIVEILSGLFTIWLASGAHTAFKDEKRVDHLEDEIKKLRIKSDIAFDYLKQLGASEAEIEERFHQHFIDIPNGFILLSTVSKSLPDLVTIIPEGTELSFYKIDRDPDGTPVIIVEATIKGHTYRIRYKQDELAIPAKKQNSEDVH